ncbi:hypothetical protein HU200_012475 [Digitaria exilis]|uniref:Uncharacterized protein n=1 Tax=Digitaria exilis TaxID=1010633 RepID=A0A835FE82_9POAL|nr:hypothetical protein HU200_012475 [Digitaria exilis]CAB3447612.1 unnamed protein product [Digitaria exilis]
MLAPFPFPPSLGVLHASLSPPFPSVTVKPRRQVYNTPRTIPKQAKLRARAAQHDEGDDRRHIPRVIRNAIDGARERPSSAGYGPAVLVQMALAHRWARYEHVVSALRSLANLSLLQHPARENARALLEHRAPFDAGVRFPEAEVFLTVDHGKFGQCVSRIQKALLRVEAATSGFIIRNVQRAASACEEFMDAVRSAAEVATLVLPEEHGKPVLYDRAVFEEDFQLTWTDREMV